MARCPGPLGAVAAGEVVAKLLHTGNVDPKTKAFRQDDLFPPTDFSNQCGQSTGSSVDRCGDLSDDQVLERSVQFAARRTKTPPPIACGARVADVDALRTISIPEHEGQLVFVYDDPLEDNERHAIIRGRAGLPRPDRSRLRDEIVDRFAKVIKGV